MTKPSPLVNHKQGRQKLQEFLEDENLKLCVISAPAHFGKTTLGQWFYEQTFNSHQPAFVQLNSVTSPLDIIDTILNDLGVAHGLRKHIKACKLPQAISHASVHGISLINTRDVSISAISNAPSEDDLILYHSDLFEAFVCDLKATITKSTLLLIVDNYEQCDKDVQRWTYKHLLRLVKLIPSIKMVFFCRKFEREKIDYVITKASREYSLGPITDREELFEWLREHGQTIDEHIESSVENAVESYSSDPMSMATALKILLPRKRSQLNILEGDPPT